ncbi:MAG: tRNA (adenosine(37)-N6)-threonylcarbamoyltransferase complex dimerization subunit type 1 TsaB, partial [Eubacteriales bacterium]|nr:tRNA (adenosine(37)-N6)-threonylcarbamoyltransferase complex dimerization subunit type 1 TsaB [Eubacteriales bacterium]
MRILTVDSSTSVAAVAVTEDGRLMGEYNIDSERTHSVNLVPMISDLLDRLQLKPQDIDLFAAVSGPGSFTGLRIGITAVKSMAYACGKPVVGIPSLDSLAYNIPVGSDIICPMIDARNRQVYMAAYRQNAQGRPEKLTDYMAADVGEAAGIIAGLLDRELDREMEEENIHGSPKVILLGDGAIINRCVLEEVLGGRCIFPPPEKMRMTASSAAAAA